MAHATAAGPATRVQVMAEIHYYYIGLYDHGLQEPAIGYYSSSPLKQQSAQDTITLGQQHHSQCIHTHADHSPYKSVTHPTQSIFPHPYLGGKKSIIVYKTRNTDSHI